MGIIEFLFGKGDDDDDDDAEPILVNPQDVNDTLEIIDDDEYYDYEDSEFIKHSNPNNLLEEGDDDLEDIAGIDWSDDTGDTGEHETPWWKFW